MSGHVFFPGWTQSRAYIPSPALEMHLHLCCGRVDPLGSLKKLWWRWPRVLYTFAVWRSPINLAHVQFAGVGDEARWKPEVGPRPCFEIYETWKASNVAGDNIHYHIACSFRSVRSRLYAVY